MFKTYYRLTKPGIIYGNLLTAVAAFLFACKWGINFGLFVAMAVGLSLVIASGCVTNNVLDRNIDKRMARTKKRALVTGEVSLQNAMIYAAVLGIAGFATLAAFTNWLTVLMAAIGWLDYVILYGWSKRTSELSTLVGSISGAMPIVVGYVAVTNHVDTSAILLFLAMTFWQMPHFYAIAMYRRDDYAAAKLPVLSVKRGMHAAKLQIMWYIAAYAVVASLLSVLGSAGLIYRVVMLAVCIWWLAKGFRTYNKLDDVKWAKGMFFASLTVVTVFSAAVAFGSILP